VAVETLETVLETRRAMGPDQDWHKLNDDQIGLVRWLEAED